MAVSELTLSALAAFVGCFAANVFFDWLKCRQCRCGADDPDDPDGEEAELPTKVFPRPSAKNPPLKYLSLDELGHD